MLLNWTRVRPSARPDEKHFKKKFNRGVLLGNKYRIPKKLLTLPKKLECTNKKNSETKIFFNFDNNFENNNLFA